MKLQIEDLTPLKDSLPKAIFRHQKNSDVHYADIRMELEEGKYAATLNGEVKDVGEDFGTTLGVRTIAKKDSVLASGYAGIVLGKDQFGKIDKIIDNLFSLSRKRALSSAEHKLKLKNSDNHFAHSLESIELAEIEVCQDTVEAEFKENPRDYSLESLTKRIRLISEKIQRMHEIAASNINAFTGFERKLFASSEGALIDMTRALSQMFIYVTAKGKAVDTFYDWTGNYLGTEVFEGSNPLKVSLEEFCKYIATGTINVANAPTIKPPSKPVTVITDPKFNALLSHEITGHPSEADRALKKESAWAGRAWWFKGLHDNMFGKQVASEQVNIVSDPTIQGYGHYKYDEEGVKAKKVSHIKNGVLNEFLNSRETATILDQEPNGGMRASSAADVPVIRMNNTFFEPGSWKKDELFKDTKEGYYLVGQKTPSIGETRQNFKITCWKLYEIKNGELGQLYRTGGITSDSHKFLLSIDAVCDDFNLYNIPNCGKGTPMQSMRVGNGGPHLRGKAKITGGNN